MHSNELRLFGAKAFPLLNIFYGLCRTKQVGTIFNFFGMTHRNRLTDLVLFFVVEAFRTLN